METSTEKNVEDILVGYGLFVFHSIPPKLFVHLGCLWDPVLIPRLSFL